MGATLVAPRAVRFSQRARWPVPEARVAAGHAGTDRRPGCGLLALAVGARRRADDVAKRAAERAEAREADGEADLRHGRVGLAQERHRPFQAAPLQVAVRRLAERVLEAADEVRAPEMDRVGERL